MIETLFYIVGGGFVGVYGLIPLLVYSQNKQPERFRLDPVPKERILEETEERFHALAEEIEANGFGYIAASAFSMQQTATHFMLFGNEEKKLYIMLTQISNPNVPTEIFPEVSQLFDDDTVIDVLNASMDPAYPPSPRKVMFRFPEIEEVSELVAVTEKIIASYLASKRAVTFPQGRELETIARLLNEEQDELIAKGYFKKEAHNGMRGVTLKGAYLMTWKLLWPIKQIRQSRNRAFAQKVLAEA